MIWLTFQEISQTWIDFFDLDTYALSNVINTGTGALPFGCGKKSTKSKKTIKNIFVYQCLIFSITQFLTIFHGGNGSLVVNVLGLVLLQYPGLNFLI